jgi:hypothetical protein
VARAKTRVRVKRAELQRIVEGRLRKAERQHERAKERYPAAVAAWEQACMATLRKALARAEKGTMPTDRYGNSRVDLPVKPPKPSENGRELCDLRRLQKTLAIGAEDSLLLSPEDSDAYFGPCPL